MADKPLEPLTRPQALYRSVQDAIRDFILENGLQPGDPLPSENQLSQQLGVSRSSVREAVKALQLVGLIEARRGSGVFVGEFSLDILIDSLPYSLVRNVQQFCDLIEIRRILEIGMIGSAIEVMDDAQIAKLEDILSQMYAAALQGKKAPDRDREFHFAIYEKLSNQTFTKLLDTFWLAFDRLRDHIDMEKHDPMGVYERHKCILQAIKAGDAEGAQECLSHHYRFLEVIRPLH